MKTYETKNEVIALAMEKHPELRGASPDEVWEYVKSKSPSIESRIKELNPSSTMDKVKGAVGDAVKSASSASIPGIGVLGIDPVKMAGNVGREAIDTVKGLGMIPDTAQRLANVMTNSPLYAYPDAQNTFNEDMAALSAIPPAVIQNFVDWGKGMVTDPGQTIENQPLTTGMNVAGMGALAQIPAKIAPGLKAAQMVAKGGRAIEAIDPVRIAMNMAGKSGTKILSPNNVEIPLYKGGPLGAKERVGEWMTGNPPEISQPTFIDPEAIQSFKNIGVGGVPYSAKGRIQPSGQVLPTVEQSWSPFMTGVNSPESRLARVQQKIAKVEDKFKAENIKLTPNEVDKGILEEVQGKRNQIEKNAKDVINAANDELEYVIHQDPASTIYISPSDAIQKAKELLASRVLNNNGVLPKEWNALANIIQRIEDGPAISYNQAKNQLSEFYRGARYDSEAKNALLDKDYKDIGHFLRQEMDDKFGKAFQEAGAGNWFSAIRKGDDAYHVKFAELEKKIFDQGDRFEKNESLTNLRGKIVTPATSMEAIQDALNVSPRMRDLVRISVLDEIYTKSGGSVEKLSQEIAKWSHPERIGESMTSRLDEVLGPVNAGRLRDIAKAKTQVSATGIKPGVGTLATIADKSFTGGLKSLIAKVFMGGLNGDAMQRWLGEGFGHIPKANSAVSQTVFQGGQAKRRIEKGTK